MSSRLDSKPTGAAQRVTRWATLLGAVLGLALGLGLLALRSHTERPKAAAPPFGEVLPEAEGPLAEVLLHWTPLTDASTAEAYGDFLSAIAADVKVRFVVPADLGASGRAALQRRLALIDPTGGLAQRTTVTEVPPPITTWSKDRALVTRPNPSGVPTLIGPSEPRTEWKARLGDWRSVPLFTQATAGAFSYVQAPFDFDAGDFAVLGHRLLFDGNLLEKNRHRGYASMAQLRARVGEWFRMDALSLGEAWGDTPRHHLSMYMTPLVGRQVLVGDPHAAATLVGEGFEPGANSLETGNLLRADFSPETVARFERAAGYLTGGGFEVVRIPNVPLDDKTYLSYTNGVYETRGERRIAYVPLYGVAALDAAALAVYAKLGWETRPIRVQALYPSHGTIGCVVNVLRRH